jgi:Kef-type K+ transport system membrane component KefB
MHADEAVLIMLISAGAFLMPIIGRRLSFIPSSVAEILFGIVIGFFLKGEINTGILPFLSDFGFILLMYLAGMEIDLDEIAETGGRNLSIYALYFVVVGMFAFSAAFITGKHDSYTLIYLTTAIGLLFPVLKETGMMERSTGKMLLILGSIGEVITLIGLMITSILFEYGYTYGGFLRFTQIAVFGIIAYSIVRLFRLYIWWFPDTMKFFLTTGNVTETGVRGSLANMMIFVALASIFHVKLIIGAFLGGFIFSAVFREKHDVQESLETFGYGFLVPIFFIDVGINFDVGILKNISVLYTALEISGIVLLTRIMALPVLYFSDMKAKDYLLVPFATAFPLTLLVAVSKIGSELGWFDAEAAGSLVLAAILTALVYPALFKYFAGFSQKAAS